MLDGGNVLETLVDELLQSGFQICDLDVELDVITVELVVVVVQQIVTLQTKFFDDLMKLINQTFHT